MKYLLNAAPQGSEEWKLSRAGKATGSRAECVSAKSRDGKSEGQTRRNYRVQLVTERLTGLSQEDTYQSPAMLAGTENEPHARMAYETETGLVVREAGFAYLPDVAAGCSVDGFVEDADGFGILELKCPKSSTHITYMLENRLPPEYVPQATHNVLITEAAFIDFASYDPKTLDKLQLFRVRVYRNELGIEGYQNSLLRFLGEVDTLEALLRKRAA